MRPRHWTTGGGGLSSADLPWRDRVCIFTGLCMARRLCEQVARDAWQAEKVDTTRYKLARQRFGCLTAQGAASLGEQDTKSNKSTGECPP